MTQGQQAVPALTQDVRLSVLMIVQDEVNRVEAAIRSVASFADEVVVVDGGSQDDTVDLCRSLGCRVLENPWPGYAQQRQYALAAARGEWVFFLDADEVVGPELAKDVRRVIEMSGASTAYAVTRVGDFFGRWVGLDEQLRMCRRDEAHILDVLVHEHLSVPARATGHLDGKLWHYGFRSVSDHVKRFDRYTTLEAEAARRAGRRFALKRLVLRPPAHFVLEYAVRGLHRRGVPGLAVALFWFLYDVLVELKVYELEWQAGGGVHQGERGSRRWR